MRLRFEEWRAVTILLSGLHGVFLVSFDVPITLGGHLLLYRADGSSKDHVFIRQVGVDVNRSQSPLHICRRAATIHSSFRRNVHDDPMTPHQSLCLQTAHASNDIARCFVCPVVIRLILTAPSTTLLRTILPLHESVLRRSVTAWQTMIRLIDAVHCVLRVGGELVSGLDHEEALACSEAIAAVLTFPRRLPPVTPLEALLILPLEMRFH